jgi:hypothetical protein
MDFDGGRDILDASFWMGILKTAYSISFAPRHSEMESTSARRVALASLSIDHDRRSTGRLDSLRDSPEVQY